LISGKPGSSFALELMRKTGFDESHIVRVRSLSGEESGRTEDLLLELSEKQQDLDALLTENVKKQEQLDLLLNEYATLKDKIQGKRKDILDDARNKASELLKEANKQIELTIRTIREHGAQPEKTKQVREKLEQFREKAVKPKEKRKPGEYQWDVVDQNGQVLHSFYSTSENRYQKLRDWFAKTSGPVPQEVQVYMNLSDEER
jgi:DNA mismatch repair protein MutS2